MMLWKAVYSDGAELNQYENGQEISWTKIDKNRLKFFDLTDGNKRLFRLHLFGGRELIYRRRVILTPGGVEEVIYLIGWKKGGEIKAIIYIHEDGTCLISGAIGLPEPYSLPVEDL